MSYIVPKNIPETCDECPFSAYSPKRNSLICTLDDNCLCVERDNRYTFCRLVEVPRTLFSKESARQYLRTDLPTDGPTVREVTE